jgi:hypothetical protein
LDAVIGNKEKGRHGGDRGCENLKGLGQEPRKVSVPYVVKCKILRCADIRSWRVEDIYGKWRSSGEEINYFE